MHILVSQVLVTLLGDVLRGFLGPTDILLLQAMLGARDRRLPLLVPLPAS
jgi:hypothetical protein